MAIKFRGVAIWATPPVRCAPRNRLGVIQFPESKEIFFRAPRAGVERVGRRNILPAEAKASSNYEESE